MAVFYKIVISPLATKTYLQNIEYLEEYWTRKEVLQFIQKVENITNILKVSPYTFKKSLLNPNIHQVEIVRQVTLFYRVHQKEVFVLLFFNNLQDPLKLRELF